MNKCYDSYSIQGIKKINRNKQKKVVDKEKEYKEVESRYNPLWADGWRIEISKEIKHILNNIIELNQALKMKENELEEKSL